MIANPVSMTAQAAWQDLLRMLKDSEVAGIQGTPRLKSLGGRQKSYWFDTFRLGDKMIDHYIGEDTEDLRERLENLAGLKEAAKASEPERARLVRLLRAEGLLTPDAATGQIFAALARAGAFRLGGTVVGTQAFRHYEGLLGVRLGTDRAAVTEDIDIASFEQLSVALNAAGDGAELAPVFRDFDFAPVPSLDRGHVWQWKQTKRNTLIEFLTPSFEDDERLRELPALGVSAQSLHFLNYLIAGAVEVPMLYRSGSLIRVPRPERFAIHKLIVAERRRDGPDAVKSRKDRAQAAFLIRHFAEEDPWLIAEAYQEAMEKGPSWREKIGRSLERMPEVRTAMESTLSR
ncbi:hypothetical protein HKCCE2091_08270 [Rhodobacterales bacterium HKCCE2091]|nr:hypothetical protein [Rhodobacterales bacterium HKCCE2091]